MSIFHRRPAFPDGKRGEKIAKGMKLEMNFRFSGRANTPDVPILPNTPYPPAEIRTEWISIA